MNFEQKTLTSDRNTIVVKWPCNVTINGMVVVVKYEGYLKGFYFLDPQTPSDELFGIDFTDDLQIQVFVQNESRIIMSGQISTIQNSCLELKNHTLTSMWSWSTLTEIPTIEFEESQQMNDETMQPFITFKENGSNNTLRRQLYALILQTKSTVGLSSNQMEYIKFTAKDDEIQCVDLPSRERVNYKLFQLNQAGNFYTISAKSDNCEFITHNTISDVTELKNMAESFIQNSDEMTVSCLYRNKPSNHETIIEAEQTGIMKKYSKDNNGDQASSINKQIHGLFFSATNDRSTNRPPDWSPFGNYRIIIPPDLLFYEKSSNAAEISGTGDKIQRNLFFADFYCKPPKIRRRGRQRIVRSSPHYVTLVLTTPGSREDRYCQNRLVKLNITKNKFLYFDSKSCRYKTIAQDDVNVEVLFTEDIDLNFMRTQSGFQEERGVNSRGESSPQGIAKHSACPKCNLAKKFDYL